MEPDTADAALRLASAVLVGVLVGLNRDLAGKPMGMRTLALVSLGAAVVSVATIHFQNLDDHPDALSRVVQGIIQGVMGGIGFIGAGVILRDHKAHTVEGLTTASTVWLTAALGIACGLAAWNVIAIAVIFALATLVGIYWLESAYLERLAGKKLRLRREKRGRSG
ncbi:MAG TPA: MgtC/SapB family protein [Methyloceanibacter sp.]|jgi:putative Mg2+ transporter-C (MgtC) family protein|nr:MgtC/SapB family protein [Methyloceanibacter sp.]